MYGAHTTPCKRFLQIETIDPLPNLRFDIEDVFEYERSHDLRPARTLAMWVPQEKRFNRADGATRLAAGGSKRQARKRG